MYPAIWFSENVCGVWPDKLCRVTREHLLEMLGELLCLAVSVRGTDVDKPLVTFLSGENFLVAKLCYLSDFPFLFEKELDYCYLV